MKRLIATFFLLFSSVTFAQQYMLLPIVEVYDGDTIKTDLAWRLPEPLNHVSIRIYGIDTPELPAPSYATTGKLGRADCVKEAEMALKAKAHVQKIVGSNTRMKVSDYEWGKYGARIIANVRIDGVDVAKSLIDEGLAVEYYGTGPRKDWCQ
jgi:endonuclease YncB( thermonuclease family)